MTILTCASGRLPLRHCLLGSAVVLLAACGGADAESEAATPAVVQARTALAAAQPFTETIGAIGTVAARPGHLAVLSSPAPARVAGVLVATGERVRAGQALVTLDQAPFAAASDAADATLAAAQQAYDRAQRLVTEGIVPRRELEQAQADLAQARAAAAGAQREQRLATHPRAHRRRGHRAHAPPSAPRPIPASRWSPWPIRRRSTSCSPSRPRRRRRCDPAPRSSSAPASAPTAIRSARAPCATWARRWTAPRAP